MFITFIYFMHINFTFYFCSNFLNNVIANIDEQNKKKMKQKMLM